MEAAPASRQRQRSPGKGRASPTAAGWDQAPGLASPTVLLPQDLRQADPHPLLPQKGKSLSRIRLIACPWTTQSMGSSRPEYWSG